MGTLPDRRSRPLSRRSKLMAVGAGVAIALLFLLAATARGAAAQAGIGQRSSGLACTLPATLIR